MVYYRGGVSSQLNNYGINNPHPLPERRGKNTVGINGLTVILHVFNHFM